MFLRICPKKISLVQRVRVKLLSRPKKCYFCSRLYNFWLTMTSQIESSKLCQYVRLYENQLLCLATKSIETTILATFVPNFLATCQNQDAECKNELTLNINPSLFEGRVNSGIVTERTSLHNNTLTWNVGNKEKHVGALIHKEPFINAPICSPNDLT